MQRRSPFAFLALATLVVFATLPLAPGSGQAKNRSGKGTSTTTSSTSIDDDPSARSGKRLDLRFDTAASVRIVGWNREEVRVMSGHKEDACEWVKAVTHSDSEGVTVRSEFSRTSDAKRCTMDVEIKVPRRYDLHLALAGGDLTISRVNGAISGSARGPVDIDNASGTIDLHSREGDVHLNHCDLDGTVYTRGGQFHEKNGEGKVRGLPERDRTN